MKRLHHNSCRYSTHSSSLTTKAGKILKKERMSFSLVYREQGRSHAWEDVEDLCLNEDLKQPFDYDYMIFPGPLVPSLNYGNSPLSGFRASTHTPCLQPNSQQSR